ncbi:hypothetical protein FOL47_009908 [Perkinsus chesapeaki]|uniref:WW domain-containing protein n=1 Tax=Perkinsus chesapeaki TaxID=330153 RepID=A0A7J6L5W8_PERCH|nr:hypothetical protein FOL47_009908 [Perkinsus chesapeaki]
MSGTYGLEVCAVGDSGIEFIRSSRTDVGTPADTANVSGLSAGDIDCDCFTEFSKDRCREVVDLRCFDTVTNRPYYYNQRTGDSVWAEDGSADSEVVDGSLSFSSREKFKCRNAHCISSCSSSSEDEGLPWDQSLNRPSHHIEIRSQKRRRRRRPFSMSRYTRRAMSMIRAGLKKWLRHMKTAISEIPKGRPHNSPCDEAFFEDALQTAIYIWQCLVSVMKASMAMLLEVIRGADRDLIDLENGIQRAQKHPVEAFDGRRGRRLVTRKAVPSSTPYPAPPSSPSVTWRQFGTGVVPSEAYTLFDETRMLVRQVVGSDSPAVPSVNSRNDTDSQEVQSDESDIDAPLEQSDWSESQQEGVHSIITGSDIYEGSEASSDWGDQNAAVEPAVLSDVLTGYTTVDDRRLERWSQSDAQRYSVTYSSASLVVSGYIGATREDDNECVTPNEPMEATLRLG